MIKSLPLAIILLLAFTQLHGQSTSTLSGAQSHGLGYASSCLFNEWAILNNVAGLAGQTMPAASISYTVNSFLPNGNSQAIAISIPTRSVVASIGAYAFGDQLYREQVISAGAASQLGLAALGIKLNYIQYRTVGFGQKGMLTFSLGGIAEITPNFFIGAHITNINQPIVSDQNDERLPTKLVVGIRYDPGKKIKVTAEIEKDIAYSPVYKMGIAYSPQEKFTFRTGFNIHPNAGFFGIGFKYRRFLLDYAFEYRMEMGISNQASLSYQFSKK